MSTIRRRIPGSADRVATVILGLSVVPASAAPGLTATFTKVSDWGTGFEGKVTVTNASSTAINGWTIEFDLPAGYSITSFWDAQHTASRPAPHVRATRPGRRPWPPARPPRFGFNGSPGNFPAASRTAGSTATPATAAAATRARRRTPGERRGHRHHQLVDLLGVERLRRHRHRLPRLRGLDRARHGHRHVSATICGLGTCTVAQLHRRRVQQRRRVGRSGRGHRPRRPAAPQPAGGRGAPYLYLGWGNPPSADARSCRRPASAGSRWRSCSPAAAARRRGTATRPLTGGVDQQTINAIRAAGGDIVPSFGGWSGNKLGPNCSTPQALAGAYQQVINAYGLQGDRHRHREHRRVRERHRARPDPRRAEDRQAEQPRHPDDRHVRHDDHRPELLRQPADRPRRGASQANIDVFTIMPFDFGGGEHRTPTRSTPSEGLKNELKSAFGWTDAHGLPAHGHLRHERPVRPAGADRRPATWTADPRLGQGAAASPGSRSGRSTATGRCPGGGVVSNCSGIAQHDWEFTRITAGF